VNILLWPNSRLKLPSREVLSADQQIPHLEHPLTLVQDMSVSELVQEMRETMVTAGGVGLSAIQVGIPLRIIVTVFPGLEVLINPQIQERLGDKKTMGEGCLSLPGFLESVPRFPELKLKFQLLEDEQWRVESANGLAAQCVQHECDHLDGKFFLDYLPAARRDKIRSDLRRGRR